MSNNSAAGCVLLVSPLYGRFQRGIQKLCLALSLSRREWGGVGENNELNLVPKAPSIRILHYMSCL